MLKKLLEKTNSPINGEIQIYSMFGVPRMSIGGLLQSGGIVSDIWKRALKNISSVQYLVSKILILGLGAGTAAKVISRKFPNTKIVGVEIDPEVIRLGKQYFGLGDIKNLKIICTDAISFVKSAKSTPEVTRLLATAPRGWRNKKRTFDLVIVDLYLGEKIPPQTESLVFLKNLKKLLSPDGTVIFNRLFWGKHKKEAEFFLKEAEKIFKKIKMVRTMANLLVICSKS